MEDDAFWEHCAYINSLIPRVPEAQCLEETLQRLDSFRQDVATGAIEFPDISVNHYSNDKYNQRYHR